jgi:hypothetical protein
VIFPKRLRTESRRYAAVDPARKCHNRTFSAKTAENDLANPPLNLVCEIARVDFQHSRGKNRRRIHVNPST